MRILIIEDEKHLADTLADLVSDSFCQTDIAYDGTDGLVLAETAIYDAIVMDVMLPGMDGFYILKRLRDRQISTPVLMLTAKSAICDKVHGLNLGADYYLTKPFDNEEFLACLRSILRRPANMTFDQMSYGDLTLVPSMAMLFCKGAEVRLSAKETELLRILICNQGHFLPKETLILKIWGYDSDISSNSVEAHVSFLRRKFSFLKSSVRISMARSLGYKLEVANDPET